MPGSLPLRVRLTALTATAVAVAIAFSAAACWFVTEHQLEKRLYRALAEASYPPGFLFRALNRCEQAPRSERLEPHAPEHATLQLVRADGRRCVVSGPAVAVTVTDLRVALGGADTVVDTTTEEGVPVRALVRRTDLPGTAMVIARPLREIEEPLAALAVVLGVVAGVGVLSSATAGALVARTALAPVDRLTAAVEHIARTEDLAAAIEVTGADEIARLGRSFNTMTAALAASREHQLQLVADAGHELRTPLTSLRANAELLQRSLATGRPLPAHRQHAMLASMVTQTQELSTLVDGLLQLARPVPSTGTGQPVEPVPVHQVVTRAVERARLRGPDLVFHVELAPWYTPVDPVALERAVVNLLDNAVKFGPADGTVQVRLRPGAGDTAELTVRDEGPGIAAEDLPHVFQRFWRSSSARALPGSGLGLAIVAQVVQRAGGTVGLGPADPATGTGTLARITLPGGAEPS